MSGLTKILFAIALAAMTASGATAQGAAEPWEAACIVKYLDPNGDGYLSVRRGPGSEFAEILRVRNGDSMPVDMRKCRGKWCYAESIHTNGRRLNQTGWFYTAWCEMIP